MRICKNGHITGYRTCSSCGTKDTRPVLGSSPNKQTDKRWKRRVAHEARHGKELGNV